MTLKELAVKHDYYCIDTNYYSRDAGKRWDTWADFYEVYHDVDIDLNLAFRWDISERENSGRYYMDIFIMHQRKGIFAPHSISYVDESDVEQIVEFLSKHKEKLDSIWKPL